MKIVIAGGTGLVGKALCQRLLQGGHEIIVLTRKPQQQSHPSITYVQWLNNNSLPLEKLRHVDAIINLAGESINNRWTKTMKRKILDSRLNVTNEIHKLIKQLPVKPLVYIQASAIGYYGTSETKTYTEEDKRTQSDFLSDVVAQWEEAGTRIEREGLRSVFMRFGVILDKQEGALPRIVLPYKAFIGGKIGSGNQWVSWVHIDDVCEMISFVLTNEKLSGYINVTAPYPVRMNEFGKTVASVLKRPHWIPVPAFALKTLLGEMSLLVLEGQRVPPEKALRHGYQFKYDHLHVALENIYQK